MSNPGAVALRMEQLLEEITTETENNMMSGVYGTQNFPGSVNFPGSGKVVTENETDHISNDLTK